MLEKTESYTSIDIKELGQVSLRKTTRVTDDGTVISESHHREVRVPNQDITDLPQHVQDTINAYWTQDVIDAWNELQQQINEESQ
jgi:archaellum component FlaF (FlaF/FlaG flagellin family)